MQSDRPLLRAGIIATLIAAGGWIVASVVILLQGEWTTTALAAFLAAMSALVVAFAWPQLRRTDPARRSVLVVVLSAILAVGLASSYALLTANDVGDAYQWIGVAAAATAAIPLAMLLWRHSAKDTGVTSKQ